MSFSVEPGRGVAEAERAGIFLPESPKVRPTIVPKLDDGTRPSCSSVLSPFEMFIPLKGF